MKKILLSTVVLVAFSLSIILFQISCKKDAIAETPSSNVPIATTTTAGIVKPDGTTIQVDANGKISTVSTNSQASADIVVYSKENSANQVEIWKVKVDGTQNQKIEITLPSGVEFNVGDGGAFKLTKDASKLIFQAKTAGSEKGSLYSCNIDGSSVKKIVDGLESLQLGDAN